MRVNGNIESLRASLLEEIDGLYDLQVEKDLLLSPELAQQLGELTNRIGREIAVYIDRKGSIVDVSIGDSGTVSLAEVEGRRDKRRLAGIRCIHTHPGGDGQLSAVDISSLINLKLDAMVALGVREGSISEIYAGLLLPAGQQEKEQVEVYGPLEPDASAMQMLMQLVRERDRVLETTTDTGNSRAERAILVGMDTGTRVNDRTQGEWLLDELEELAVTAGVEVVRKLLQKRSTPNAAYYVGKGLVEEICLMRQALDADILIFDDELSGAQVRNIEEMTGARVIDRTTLILDIFAQRARSREGKIQVELAQLKYRLPRLMGMGTQLSRLGGGIGTRGPGEKKLETDRRHIRRRIVYLEEQLREIGKRRGLVRESRKKDGIPSVALVGYTNAGKSTLLNSLCGADVLVEDKLFATLDPTTRGLDLGEGKQVMLVDTVGFIRKLPHDLVEAFKSTLEVAVYADALLHVVDAASPEAGEQVRVVDELLLGLGALDKPVILCLNKSDLLQEKPVLPGSCKADRVVEISARSGMGMDELKQEISRLLARDEVELRLLVPYTEGWVIPYIHQYGKLLEQEYVETGTLVRAVVARVRADKLVVYADTGAKG